MEVKINYLILKFLSAISVITYNVEELELL